MGEGGRPRFCTLLVGSRPRLRRGGSDCALSTAFSPTPAGWVRDLDLREGGLSGKIRVPWAPEPVGRGVVRRGSGSVQVASKVRVVRTRSTPLRPTAGKGPWGWGRPSLEGPSSAMGPSWRWTGVSGLADVETPVAWAGRPEGQGAGKGRAGVGEGRGGARDREPTPWTHPRRLKRGA